MFTLNIDLGNRTEYIVFETLWAADCRARQLIRCSGVKSVKVVKNGMTYSMYKR